MRSWPPLRSPGGGFCAVRHPPKAHAEAFAAAGKDDPATDEIGFHAVQDRHYVTDIHATVLHQLGLDPRKLEVPGHKRLELGFGKPIREVIA